jgi:hypothetical protein
MIRSKAVQGGGMLHPLREPYLFSKVYGWMFRERSLRALGMGSGKEADAAQECPTLTVYSVQRDVGAVTKQA